jgi:hypothetical protein
MFEALRAKSFERLPDALTHGEYVGWLAIAPTSPTTIIGSAGSLFAIFCRIQLSDQRMRFKSPRAGMEASLMFLSNRSGADAVSRHSCLDASSIRPTRKASTALCSTHSEEGRSLYERFGFVATDEMRFAGG